MSNNIQKLLNFLDRQPLVLPVSVYLLSYLTSSVMGINSPHSFSFVKSELLKFGALVLLLRMLPSVNWRQLMPLYAAGGVLSAVLGIKDVAVFYLSNGVIPRAGFAHAPNVYAQLLLFPFLLSGCLALCEKGRAAVLDAASAGVMAIAVILSGSRSVFLATAFAVILLFILVPHLRKKLLLAAAGGLALLVLLHFAGVDFRLGSAARLSKIAAGKLADGPDLAVFDRLTMWKTAFRIIRDYPLFGIGPHCLGEVFYFYHKVAIDGVSAFGDVHNLFLQQSVERGVFGLFALVYFLFSIFRLLVRAYARTKNPYTLWAIVAASAYMITQCFDSTFYLVQNFLNMAFAVAVAVAADMERYKSVYNLK